MSLLLTADIHLSDSIKDDYRWNLIPWLQQQVIEHSVSQVLFLGDSTDQKDHHSASLVNRFVQQLTDLSGYCDVLMLYGNHDGISENQPYFNFIDEFKSNITFISKITSYWLKLGQGSVHCLFLPCTRNWREDWKGIDFDQYDLIFTHQTYDGAKAETGIQLPGIPPSIFKDFKGKVYSGDIHVPQKLLNGRIEYCGSPYRCRFGDLYDGRVLLINDNLSTQSLTFPCINKHVVSIGSIADLLNKAVKQSIMPDDQVKIRVSLSRQDLPTWKSLKEEIKQVAADQGWQLFGPELLPIKDSATKASEPSAVYKTSEQILAAFVEAKKLSERQAKIGFSLIKDSP